MKIIYAIDGKLQITARIHIGCESYQMLFIEFLLSRGMSAAVTEEASLPVRSHEEEDFVNELLEAFHNHLNSKAN